MDGKEISCSRGFQCCAKYIKMVCNTNQFLSFPFCGPHTKKHGVRGLSKHYCMMFDPKLGHGVCSIGRIPCVCNEYTYMLDKP